MNRILLATMSLLIPTACAAAAEPEKTGAPAPSIQQRFNAAKDLRDGGKFSEALSAFAALEADVAKTAKPGSINLALVRAFRAGTVVRTSDSARDVQVLNDIIALPESKNATLAIAKSEAHDALSFYAIQQLDDAVGAGHLAEVQKNTADPIDRLVLMTRQSLLLSILSPTKAIALADEALALAEAIPKFDKVMLGSIYNAKGRALLNSGDAKAARVSFAKAISVRGGLDLKIDYSEFSSRSDAAIAELRLNSPETARRFLAYTGSGRTEASFLPGSDMPLPQCGGLDGLLPDDSAVIELSLARDGSVKSARPVLASRPGEMAYSFAKAAKEWFWNSKSISGLSDFTLRMIRLEVRCSNTAERPSIGSDMFKDQDAWFSDKNVKLDAMGEDEKPNDWIMRSEQKSGKLGRAAALLILKGNWSFDGQTRKAYALEAEQLLRAAGAPAKAWLHSAISSRVGWTGYRMSPSSIDDIAQLLEDPAIKSDSILSARLNLYLAELATRARNWDAEELALTRVKNDQNLASNDPLKIAALIALANSAVAKKDLAAAALYYDQTGLDARQCAALDAKPVMQRSGVSSSDFPMEAMAWGFEGWTRQEYDIRADGKTENLRTLISYPPSVFEAAAIQMTKGFRYRPSFRPEGGLGCGGAAENVRFTIMK